MRYPSWLPVTNEASHTFVPSIMTKRPVVLDLGANVGECHDCFFRRFRPERHVAVEPTPSLAAGLVSRGLNVVEAAVAPKTGPILFSVDANSEASSILAEVAANQVDGISYSDLLTREHLERIDLVKVDIEGAEVFALADTARELLRAATRSPWSSMTSAGFTPDQVNDLIVRMHLMGFYGVRFSNNNTDWLFVRKDTISPLGRATMLARAWFHRVIHTLSTHGIVRR